MHLNAGLGQRNVRLLGMTNKSARYVTEMPRFKPECVICLQCAQSGEKWKTYAATGMYGVAKTDLAFFYGSGSQIKELRPYAPMTLTVRPDAGQGPGTELELVGTDPNGLQDIATTVIIINSSFIAANSCYVSHDQGTNIIWLSSDDTKSWMPVTPGVSNIAQNSQCILKGQDSSITTTDRAEVLRLSLTFKDSFAGDKKIYAVLRGRSGDMFNWAQIGSWRVTTKK